MTESTHDLLGELRAGADDFLLVIISSPSGAGKTTLCNRLRTEFGTLAFSIAPTTDCARWSWPRAHVACARRLWPRHCCDRAASRSRDFLRTEELRPAWFSQLPGMRVLRLVTVTVAFAAALGACASGTDH